MCWTRVSAGGPQPDRRQPKCDPAGSGPARSPATHRLLVHRSPGLGPPARLEAFLQRGPEPIAITFGSMSTPNHAKLARVLVEGVVRSGVRAVIPAGRLRIDPDSLPPDVFVTGDVPYHWLFRRVAAVIHHGGAGTTAAALRAGIPSAFVPHIADNNYWARVVRDLGAAPAPIAYQHFSAGRLAKVIGRSSKTLPTESVRARSPPRSAKMTGSARPCA